MKLTPGSRWKSAVCDTEVVLVKAPAADVKLECGGATMLALGEERPPGGAPAPGLDGETRLGKRYSDDGESVEVLCTKPGKGTLSLDGQPLVVKEAKRLPSTD